MSARTFSKLAKRTVAGVSTFALGGYFINTQLQSQSPLSNDSNTSTTKFPPFITQLPQPPTRQELLAKLGSTVKSLGFKQEQIDQGALTTKDAQSKYDVIVVGGGATGSGTALDLSLRGLKVLVLEKNDFASGTSSKSTKMAHGGVRYLEKAIFQLSKAQLNLVIEALNERASILENAPHLASCLPILIPVYKYWQLPYFYAGCLIILSWTRMD
ncbi:unnamed protein product [Ambrosiozyma monospora]|uniref:Unnamed protein product n=1 Tax=Ambrosiozyma monospora TaxID=43982 RepID=A0ACB5UAQ2_AMBMO|nr:unnamed protein product [Ambrosiozyma monospora]